MTTPDAATIEQAARELLNEELVKAGWVYRPEDKWGAASWSRQTTYSHRWDAEFEPARKAISTALRSRSDLRDEICSEAFSAELDEKEFRDCFAEDQIRVRLALQIRALRQQRGLSQSQFGELVGTPQSGVARFENPDSGRLTLGSLFRIAAAFDIAFIGEFVDHRDLLERTRSMTKERLEVESYTAQTLRAATPITTAGDMG